MFERNMVMYSDISVSDSVMPTSVPGSVIVFSYIECE